MARPSPTLLWRRKPTLMIVTLLVVVVALVAAACTSGSDGNAASDANASREAAGLNPLTDEQVNAALKTYLPSGEHDPYIMFASGGHSGQMFVIGVPSMRILKEIGVFTAEPWQGLGIRQRGHDGDARTGRCERQRGPLGRHPPSRAVRDRRGIRRPIRLHQRQGQRTRCRDRSAGFRDQADRQEPDRHRRPRWHQGDAEHGVDHSGRPVRRTPRVGVLSLGELRRGTTRAWSPSGSSTAAAVVSWRTSPLRSSCRRTGRICVMQASSSPRDGSSAARSTRSGQPASPAPTGVPFEAGASARDNDYLHVINLDKAVEVFDAGNTFDVNGLPRGRSADADR